MALRCTVTGKEAMASRRATFLAARDRAHGKEPMESRCAEFITTRGCTSAWVDFDASMAEWVVDLEVAKAAQKERKRQKEVKKRESRRRKKKRLHAMVRRAWRRSKHGGLSPTRPGRRTPVSGQHALIAACEKEFRFVVLEQITSSTLSL